MLSSFSPSQIERFKREAKALSKVTGVSHSEALDQIAKAHQFNNWSLLMKSREQAPNTGLGDSPCKPYMFRRSFEEMRLARCNPETRHSELDLYAREKLMVRDISQEFISPSNVVEFTIDYITKFLRVGRFHLSPWSVVLLEMRTWLPYRLQEVDGSLIFVNREYQPVGRPGADLRIQSCHSDYPSLKVHQPLELFTYSTPRLWPISDDGYLHGDYSEAPWCSRKGALDYFGVVLALKRRFQELGVE